jgi:hypothetical protein
MKEWQKEIEAKIRSLGPVQDRNPLKMKSTRANFIQEAKKARTVSLLPESLHKWWKPVLWKKEALKMNIATLLVILSLLFGGTGATAVAAQASLPGDFLYPVKIFAEDLRMDLTTQPENKVDIALKHAARRYDEIQTLLEEGYLPPDPTVFSAQFQIRIALEEALASDEPAEQLQLVQQMLQKQYQKMNYLEIAVEPAGQAWMHQFQFLFENQLQMVGAGLKEPQKLQQELQFMNQFMNQLEAEGEANQWQQMFQIQAQSLGEDTQYQWQFQNAHQIQQGITDGEAGQNKEQVQPEDPKLNNGAEDTGENGNGEAKGTNGGTNTNGNGQNGGSGGNGGGGN